MTTDDSMDDATQQRSTRPLLVLDGVRAGYGALEALHGISLEVHRGEIVALLGANGAGKSTTLRVTSGTLPLREGSVIFDGSDTRRLSTEKLVARGLRHVPERAKVFRTLSVDENLEMGAYLESSSSLIRDRKQRVYDIFPALQERRSNLADTLSGGEQQMLALGMSLMTDPILLLLDEPSLGLAPFLVKETFSIIERINTSGTTILVVEQNATMALQVAHRAYVIEVGNIVKEGAATELAADPAVREAYLGAA
jgi:branched-chain amino acid transport system ATP-binding protein